MTSPQTLYEQALAAQNAGDLARAETLYRELVAATPVPEALVNLGNVLNRQGRSGEALAQYDRALAAAPGLVPALFNSGNALLSLARADEALARFDRALALRPDVAGAWNNRGNALRALRRHGEALESYRRAVALDAGHVNALTNVAIALYDLKRFDEALDAADRPLAAAPDFAEALYVKANILSELGQHGAALAHYERALAANPAHPHALNGAARMALALCDWERVAALKPRLHAAITEGRGLIQPFTLLGYDDDAVLQRRCAEQAIHRMAPARTPLANGRYKHGKIRLAYLSADFHSHATAVLMAELFERHDRDRFEIFGIGFGPDDNSALRARLLKGFDHFEDVRGKSDLDVARMLRGMEIDIAVDLNGHTLDARPGIFAHRPAPVQVNYLVYPGTTGASYMDFILADRVVLPPAQQAFFSERIIHLPDCYQANDATRPVPSAPSRIEAGLPEEGFVFCCFNGHWKITRDAFDIWMRLLAKVEGSVLWLLDGTATAALQAQAKARGIDPARLIFAPKAPQEAHLARQRLADLFLDTFLYNAHTTASDALWAGVPLVTCIGTVFQSRVAASLLNALGMPELVTVSPGAYQDLALELAQNPALLKATREKLARNHLTMPLYDSARFAAGIEAAYEAMLS